MKRRFMLVDVFTETPMRGNGLAVVLDADGLSAETMQRFAKWIGLAESAFLAAPDHEEADYAVRIFTPERELPFAGHPTLGSCAAWLAAGGAPRGSDGVVQSCGVGRVEIDLSGEVPAFVAPPADITPLPPGRADAIAAALQIDRSAVLRSASVVCGPEFQVLELASAQDVLAAESRGAREPDLIGLGLIGPHPAGSDCDVEVRHIEPHSGTGEDPVTGSLNAGIAQWLAAQGRLTAPYVAAQGTALGRAGRVHVRPTETAGRILVGGRSHILADGEIAF